MADPMNSCGVFFLSDFLSRIGVFFGNNHNPESEVKADEQQKGLKSSSYVNSVSFFLGESFSQTIHSRDQVRVNGEQSSIKADEP